MESAELSSRLLARGYLPQQVPPLVQSEVFAAQALPEDGELPIDPDDPKRNWTTAATYNAARHGGLRRRLSILNPHSYLNTARVLASMWPDLDGYYGQSALSLSRPTVEESNRALESSDLFNRRDLQRLRAVSRSRFRLRTDVAQCYSTMYTHSISWALNGKAKAKAALATKDGLPGDDLDSAVRASQEGQTIGIPVGPDTSLAVAEVILCDIDARLELDDASYIDGFRTIDDFELFFSTRAAAERALSGIERAAAHYELALNPHKTSIDPVPLEIEDPWKSRLQALVPHGKVSPSRVMAFLNELMQLSRQYPGEAVVAYGLLQAADFTTPEDGKRLIVEGALASIQFSAPAMRYAIPVALHLQPDAGLEPDTIWEVLNNLIRLSAPAEYSYEVCWALWGLLASGGELDPELATLVANLNDPTAAAIYMYMRDGGKANGPPASRLGELQTYAQVLKSDAWLLAYEAHLRGWAAFDQVADSPFFSTIADRGVTFLPSVEASDIASPDPEDWTFGLFNQLQTGGYPS